LARTAARLCATLYFHTCRLLPAAPSPLYCGALPRGAHFLYCSAISVPLPIMLRSGLCRRWLYALLRLSFTPSLCSFTIYCASRAISQQRRRYSFGGTSETVMAYVSCGRVRFGHACHGHRTLKRLFTLMRRTLRFYHTVTLMFTPAALFSFLLPLLPASFPWRGRVGTLLGTSRTWTRHRWLRMPGCSGAALGSRGCSRARGAPAARLACACSCPFPCASYCRPLCYLHSISQAAALYPLPALMLPLSAAWGRTRDTWLLVHAMDKTAFSVGRARRGRRAYRRWLVLLRDFCTCILPFRRFFASLFSSLHAGHCQSCGHRTSAAISHPCHYYLCHAPPTTTASCTLLCVLPL